MLALSPLPAVQLVAGDGHSYCACAAEEGSKMTANAAMPSAAMVGALVMVSSWLRGVASLRPGLGSCQSAAPHTGSERVTVLMCRSSRTRAGVPPEDHGPGVVAIGRALAGQRDLGDPADGGAHADGEGVPLSAKP